MTKSPMLTLRGKLLLMALLVEALMLFLLVSNSIRLLRDNMGEQARRNAEQIVPVLQAALVAPLAQSDYATVQAVLDESHATKTIDYLAVLDAEGRIVASAGLADDKKIPNPDPSFALDSDEDPPRYDVVQPIALAHQRLGTLHFGLNLKPIIGARNSLMTQGAVSSSYRLSPTLRLPLTVFHLLLIGVLVLGIRGGWQQIPINESSAYFSKHQVANDAAVNTFWNAGEKSAWHRQVSTRSSIPVFHR